MSRCKELVDAGDEALRGAAVLHIICPEGAGEGRFFYMDAIEQSGKGQHQDNPERQPIVHLQAEGEENQHHSCV